MALALAAIFVLGRFTPQPPPVEPEGPVLLVPDATTTTLDQAPPVLGAFAEQGQPLAWEAMAGIGDHRPLAVVELDGEMLFFTAPASNPVGNLGQTSINDPGEGGLYLWWPFQSENRPVARAMQVIPSGVVFQTVEETSFGLLATGVEPDTGMPSTWTSFDGLDWSRWDLRDEAGDPIHVYETHVHDGMTLTLASSTSVLGSETARRAAIESYGDAAVSMVQLTRDRYAIFGPLGLFIGVKAVDEGFETRQVTHVLRTSDGIEWEVLRLPDSDTSFLASVVAGPDGKVWALAYEFHGPVVFSSPDGSEWRRHDDGTSTSAGGVYTRLMGARPWAGSHLTLGGDPTGGTVLLTSDDLVEWRELYDFATILAPPPSWRTWNLRTWSTGPEGIALVAQRTLPVSDVEREEPAATLHKDGYTLEVTRQNVVLRGRDADIQASRFYFRQHSRIEIDLETRSVVFTDGKGAELVRFTYAELAALDVPETPDRPVGPMSQAFLHSPDGVTWDVQDISSVTGGTWATHLALHGDRVYMVTGSHSGGPLNPGNHQGWILTARLP